MSDRPADDTERLNLREQVARIDRSLDEAAKYRSERVQLDAEAAKLHRDRFLAPAVALAATLGAIAALATHNHHRAVTPTGCRCRPPRTG